MYTAVVDGRISSGRIERRLLAAPPSSSRGSHGNACVSRGCGVSGEHASVPEGGVCLAVCYRRHLVPQNGCICTGRDAVYRRDAIWALVVALYFMIL